MRLGCNHSFGNELLEVEWQHIQVAEHADTHTMFLQVVPKERETRELYGGAENSNKLKEEQEEQEDYSILETCPSAFPAKRHTKVSKQRNFH